jgi:hypothetical protein
VEATSFSKMFQIPNPKFQKSTNLHGTASYPRSLRSSFQVLLCSLLVNLAKEGRKEGRYPAFLLACSQQMCKLEHLENISMNVLRSGVKIKPEQLGYAHIWGYLGIHAGCEYIFQTPEGR